MEFGLEEPKKIRTSTGWTYERYNGKWHIPERSLQQPLCYGDNIFAQLIYAKDKEQIDYILALDSIYFAKNIQDIENLIKRYPDILKKFIIRKPFENRIILEYLLKMGCQQTRYCLKSC